MTTCCNKTRHVPNRTTKHETTLHVPQLKRDMLDCSAVAHAFVLMITPTALITFCQNSSSILILLDQLHQLRLVLIPCLRSLDE